MKPEEYIEKAKSVLICLKGIDANGMPFEIGTATETGERPTVEDCKKVADRSIENGEVEFSDVAYFEIPVKATVSKVEMYYSTVLVGMREFFDIEVAEGDTFEVTWGLRITKEGKKIAIFT